MVQTRKWCRAKCRQWSEGFSLVELMVVLAVAAVCSLLVLPSLGQMVRSQRGAALVHSWVTSLHSARSEAIKRNARVVLCKSSDGQACSSQGGWEQGWILFQDTNNNAVRENQESLISTHPAVEGLRLTGNYHVARYVSFGATGTAKLVSGGFQSGTFTLCAPEDWNLEARQVVLSSTGRPRIIRGASKVCP